MNKGNHNKGHDYGRHEEAGIGPEDDYGDFEGAQEDEAPEAVQALAGPSPWATFPDLLRVQSGNSSSSALGEDETPESLSFTHRLRTTINCHPSSSSQPNGRVLSSEPGTSNGNHLTRRDTGAIPKAGSRAPMAPPPDVSQIILSSVSNSGTIGPKPSIPVSRSGNDLLDLCVSGPVPANRRAGSSSREDEDRLNHLEREVVSLQTHKVVLQQQLTQREGQLRDIREAQSGSQLGPIMESLTKLQATLDNLSRDMNERLNRLESRLNNLVINDKQVGVALLSSDANLNQTMREEIRSHCEQQRKDLENERKAYLMSFSDMFKKAAESLIKPAARNMNGPHH